MDKNKTATIFKGLAVFVWIIGGITAIIIAFFVSNALGSGGFVGFLLMAITFFIAGLPLYAYGEIIQLLHSVDLNTRRENKGKSSKQEIPLVRRAFLLLEESDWEKADALLEQALNQEPENAKAYIGKLCVELRMPREEDLLNYDGQISSNNYYRRAVQFADEGYKNTLHLYALTPDELKTRKESGIDLLLDKARQIRKRFGSVDRSGLAYDYQQQDKEIAHELNIVLSELEQYGDYKDVSQLLQEFTTPINERCPLCGWQVQMGSLECRSCGISFSRNKNNDGESGNTPNNSETVAPTPAFCYNCGAKLQNDTNFCYSCGKPIT